MLGVKGESSVNGETSIDRESSSGDRVVLGNRSHRYLGLDTARLQLDPLLVNKIIIKEEDIEFSPLLNRLLRGKRDVE